MKLRAVVVNGSKNWKKIADKIGNVFTPDQCNQHLHRVLSPRIIKVEWTSDEDLLLFKQIKNHGERAWGKKLKKNEFNKIT